MKLNFTRAGERQPLTLPLAFHIIHQEKHGGDYNIVLENSWYYRSISPIWSIKGSASNNNALLRYITSKTRQEQAFVLPVLKSILGFIQCLELISRDEVDGVYVLDALNISSDKQEIINFVQSIVEAGAFTKSLKNDLPGESGCIFSVC